ncbi:MAG TPA: transglutaminase-like domain-containing protein [Thermodesulfobacteriota bacterium]|nr:transglutaminase-like domain-containing protein [Thermodesulfobacteriota bacterium]
MEEEFLLYMAPTAIIDSDHPSIREYASKNIGGSTDPVEIAVKLYLAVRDGILYDPYTPFYLPEHYRASCVLERGRSFCVPKASLLCALGRACGIPSRIGFADVRNHLATKQLIQFLGSDLFVYHGFTEFRLGGKWVKATPAFNSDLCKRHRVPPLEFNGREDSIFQSYNLRSQRFMEYVAFHGVYADVPVDRIVAEWEKTYGRSRVRDWIKRFEEAAGRSLADFGREEVLQE